MRRRNQRGFSLIEIALIAAIIALLVAVVVPSFRKMQDRERVSAVTREVLNHLRKARQEASAGRIVGGTRAFRTALRIDSPTRYSIVAVGTGTVTVTSVDFETTGYRAKPKFINPAPNSEIRFKNDGTSEWVLAGGGTTQLLTIGDEHLKLKRNITVNGVGVARVAD